MVKVELAGKPAGDLDTSSDNVRLTDRVRQRIRSSITTKSRRVSFNWDTVLPRLVISSDTHDFDVEILSRFQEEGFQVSYLEFKGDRGGYQDQLQSLADDLEAGDRYAIVAYGEAAAICLEACIKPMPKLVALVAYYPTFMPRTNADFPPALSIQVHLAASQKFGTRHPSYRYPGTEDGFAEHDVEEFDAISAGLAWSRTLGNIRQAFGLEIDNEQVMDQYMSAKYGESDVERLMSGLVKDSHLINVPNMTGGVGSKDLHRFYVDFFLPSRPSDMKIKLLSRTVGADRVVDELLCTFRHTCEMPWLLPGIPPTDRRVEIVLVSIVGIQGGKISHEHLYWDQASVLVQVGLLDPKYISPSFITAGSGREANIDQLPVFGAEIAKKVMDEKDGPMNTLISGWSK